MDAITLIEYLFAVGVAFFIIRAVYKKLTSGTLSPVHLKVELKGQIAAVRDPVLLHYRTNPEVYGVSDDVALSASILRTRVQIWKTIIICGIVGLFCFLVGTGVK
jgi:hypothetical protein